MKKTDYKNEVWVMIPGELPDLNTYIRANRANKFIGAKIKKEATEIARLLSITCEKIKAPCFFEFHWYCKDTRKDPDNICFAKKFILDGFQESKFISEDSWKMILGLSDFFYVDKEDPRIEICVKYN